MSCIPKSDDYNLESSICAEMQPRSSSILNFQSSQDQSLATFRSVPLPTKHAPTPKHTQRTSPPTNPHHHHHHPHPISIRKKSPSHLYPSHAKHHLPTPPTHRGGQGYLHPHRAYLIPAPSPSASPSPTPSPSHAINAALTRLSATGSSINRSIRLRPGLRRGSTRAVPSVGRVR